jgi:hypothetical protein
MCQCFGKLFHLHGLGEQEKQLGTDGYSIFTGKGLTLKKPGWVSTTWQWSVKFYTDRMNINKFILGEK